MKAQLRKRGKPPRLVIVFDGKAWYVRRVACSRHDGIRDEKVYYCDEPLSNGVSLTAAVRIARELLAKASA